jgi:hypothetical protein
MSYTPLAASEAGSTVTVVLPSLSTRYASNVCDTATVTITVPGDLDGDGNQIIRIKPSVPTANGLIQ